MPPKRKAARKKDQPPPLSVQGLLHLQASFVTPKQTESKLATVTPGSLPLYGYGDGVDHAQAQAEETSAVNLPSGPGGDAPVPPPPPPPPPEEPQQAVQQFYSELAAAEWPPAPAAPAGPDMNDPEQYEPPDFASQPPAAAAVDADGASTQDQTPVPAPTAASDGVASGVQQVSAETVENRAGEPSSAEQPAVVVAGERPEEAMVTDEAPVAVDGGAPVPVTGQQAAAEERPPATVLSSDGTGAETPAAPLPPLPPSTPGQPASAEAAATADTGPLPEPAVAQPDVPDPTAILTSLSAVLPEQWGAADDGMLSHYWQFVRENPYDFNGWTYLLQHVEKQTNLDAIRAVYNAFLPLYPYCYAYWKKYSDLEQRSGYRDRSLQILERGVKAIPLSVDLWMAVLNQTRVLLQGQPDAEQQIRALCERALASAGRQFRADELWESYLAWESGNGVLHRVTAIYRRLLHIPTRLYNRHWDNFLQHVRDYHPRDTLPPEEYIPLRRECCAALGMPHREEPPAEKREAAKTEKPEVKLIAAIKERVVADMVTTHELTEKRAERRWKLEDKIKRPYFHVVPLDRRQLRAWRDYLQLEASDGDHHSLVLLYERCLIACAQYEEFWAQYARYLERRLDAAAEPAAEAEAEAEQLPPADPAAGVREVYKRACLVHCPTKPSIRLQWAAFEESRGHAETALQLIGQVESSFSGLARPRLQRIGLERRRGRLQECHRLYAAATEAAPPQLTTWWAMKHARFCFKILNKPDKALAILRTAVKRDRSNPRLYLHILDVCYQRHPVDIRGVTAALKLAINSKELSESDKLGFRRKRVEVCEEYGSLRQLQQAEDELAEAERTLAAAERRRQRQQQQEQTQQQEEQQQDQQQDQQPAADGTGQGEAKKNAESNTKRKRKAKMDPTPPPPVPTVNGEVAQPKQEEPPKPCPKCGWDGREESLQSQQQPPPINYEQVPPTWDLTVPTQAYGYGKDPHYKWFQDQGYREYSAKELGGYPASLLDPVSSDEEGKPQQKRPRPGEPVNIVTSDGRTVPRYVITPKTPLLAAPPAGTRPLMAPPVQQPTAAPGGQEPPRPPQLAPLPPPEDDSACRNVPDWLLNEGGELCLSETENGTAMLRYWPRFMTDTGVKRMFSTLRRYVKWHQTRQIAPDGRFVALKRLVAWYGACGLDESGLVMPANDNWPPELLDLLTRLCQFTGGQQYNSCHLSLFRTGHDLEPWHAHQHACLGANPSIAVISLGAIRHFELRQRNGDRFLRFPLLPGSLLVMEGATQVDWLHQIPKDSGLGDERIGLQFRTMYDLREM